MTFVSPASPQGVERSLRIVPAARNSKDRTIPAVEALPNMRTVLTLLLTGVLLGCGDSPVRPDEPNTNWSRSPQRVANFSGDLNEEVTVTGQTLGPDGQFYTVQNSRRTHQNFYFLDSFEDWHDTLAVYDYELESTLLPSSSTPYNGGDISILITHGSQTVAAGGVHGNMDTGKSVFAVPAGATVTLEAYPNAGCRFEGWTVNSTTYQSTSTVFVDYGGGGSRNYTGVFHCHPGY